MIRQAKESDFDEWLRMRKQLFSEYSPDELLKEIEQIYFERSVVGELDYVVYVFDKGQDQLGGFIETSLRRFVEDCQTSPIGYIESLYVDSELRRKGIAKELVKKSEDWIIRKNCSEYFVDTDPDMPDAIDFYLSYGFQEIRRKEEEIIFRKTPSV